MNAALPWPRHVPPLPTDFDEFFVLLDVGGVRTWSRMYFQSALTVKAVVHIESPAVTRRGGVVVYANQAARALGIPVGAVSLPTNHDPTRREVLQALAETWEKKADEVMGLEARHVTEESFAKCLRIAAAQLREALGEVQA